MALTLVACIKEECDGLSFVDKTRDYDATTNPTGYGPENGVTGPSDFDTLTLSFWDASVNPATATATAVINMLTDVPAQSPDDDYDWATFLFAQLGVSTITDGVAYFEYVGVKDGVTYRADFTAVMTKNLYDILKVKMASWKPGGCAKPGCIPVDKLWNALRIVQCGGTCSNSQTTTAINWIKSNLNAICC